MRKDADPTLKKKLHSGTVHPDSYLIFRAQNTKRKERREKKENTHLAIARLCGK